MGNSRDKGFTDINRFQPERKWYLSCKRVDLENKLWRLLLGTLLVRQIPRTRTTNWLGEMLSSQWVDWKRRNQLQTVRPLYCMTSFMSQLHFSLIHLFSVSPFGTDSTWSLVFRGSLSPVWCTDSFFEVSRNGTLQYFLVLSGLSVCVYLALFVKQVDHPAWLTFAYP